MRNDRRSAPTAPPRRSDSRRPHSRPRRPVAPTGPSPRHAPQEWFAQLLVLVLSGQRPVHSLLKHAYSPAYEQLGKLAEHTPLRPAPGSRGAPSLHGVGVCHPGPGIIEAFARVTVGDRTRALAFRLERSPDQPEVRWRCQAVEMDITVPG